MGVNFIVSDYFFPSPLPLSLSRAILALVIYFIAGALLMYFVKGAHGIEIIPNYIFWKSFPFLVAVSHVMITWTSHDFLYYRRVACLS